jgi:hypothetical protein
MTESASDLDLLRLQGTLGVRLSQLHGAEATVHSILPIADDRAEGELKHVGYGQPLLVRFEVAGESKTAVFRTQGQNWFGHDRRSDRAALALLAADTYAEIPDHVRVLDVGALTPDETLVPLVGTGELYLLTSYVEGSLYAKDLRRIERTGQATTLDIARASTLATWIARLHQQRIESPPELYQRALRDLLGSGEGIFGIVDSYPDDGPIPRDRLAAIEHRCLDWRHRLRGRHERLRRTHGDFHPYNVLFRSGVELSVLDASRGCRGDPADDVAAMGINFLLAGALAPQAWDRGLAPLYRAFFSSYLDATHDGALLEVIPPFLAWRLLVVASPVWYPGIPAQARDALLRVAEQSLDQGRLDLEEAERTILG